MYRDCPTSGLFFEVSNKAKSSGITTFESTKVKLVCRLNGLKVTMDETKVATEFKLYPLVLRACRIDEALTQIGGRLNGDFDRVW